MSQLSDKELDQLSQKAAEQYDPGLEHNPGSWENLEQRLTRDLGRARPSLFRGYRRIPFLYAPIVVLLVGVSYFMAKQNARQHSSRGNRSDTASFSGLTNSGPPGALRRVIPSAASPQATDDPIRKKNLSPKIEVPEKNSTTENTLNTHSPTDPVTGINRNNRLPDGSASASTPSRLRGGSTEGIVEGVAKSTEKKTRDSRYILRHENRSIDGTSGSGGSVAANNSGNTEKSGTFGKYRTRRGKGAAAGKSSVWRKSDAAGSSDAFGKGDASGKPVAGNPDASGKSGAHGNADAPSPLFYSAINGPVSFTHSRPVVYDSALRAAALEIAARKKAAANAKSRSLHINNPLQIGLLYGPEFTLVKSVEGAKPGHNFGLTLGYKLFAGFSVNTGLLWNRTNYTAPAADFHPPQGSWFANNNMVQLHFVQGSMNMIEIPLNIRYDLKVPDNSLFYVSAGLSSYLAGNENCLYYYENFGMNRRAPEKINDRASYWFSALNLAFGFEKPITSTFSFQAEPYLKLPLNGIGAGNVQLNSFGLNLSVKYTPVLGRSRR